MVYIENTLEEQHIFIPRNDNQGSYESSYDKGYSDGYSDGLEDCESCPLQDKEVILTAVTQTITADTGYAGMERVFVDGRQLATEKYIEGYREGEGDGQQEQKDKLTSTTFTRNGVYTREDGWSGVTVDVPLAGILQEKSTTLESGDTSPWVILPDSGYNGMTKVTVTDNGYGQKQYQDGYSDGFQSGSSAGCQECYDEGVNDQKALLSTTAITQNGEYSNENGWSGVSVDVQPSLQSKTVNLDSGFTGTTVVPDNGYYGMSAVTVTDDGYGQEKYNDGVADGENNIRSAMTSTAFTQNDTYQNASGWSAVTVNVQPNLQAKSVRQNQNVETHTADNGYDGLSSIEVDATGVYSSGHTDGVNYAKSLLSSIKIKQNDTYTNADGWSSVTVDVRGGCPLEDVDAIMTATTQTFTADTLTRPTVQGYTVYGGSAYEWEDVITSNHNIITIVGEGNDVARLYYSNGECYVYDPSTSASTAFSAFTSSWTRLTDWIFFLYDGLNLFFYGEFMNMSWTAGDIQDLILDVDTYCGISEIEVSASALCQSYYDSGVTDGCNSCYQSGYTDGYNDALVNSKPLVGLKFDGNSYFDTGLYSNENTRLELYLVPFQYDGNASGSPYYFAGCENGNGDNSSFYMAQDYGVGGQPPYYHITYKFGNKTSTNWDSWTIERVYKMASDKFISVYNFDDTPFIYYEYDGYEIVKTSGSSYSMTVSPNNYSGMDVCNYTIYLGANHNPSLSSATPSYRPATFIFIGAKIYDNCDLVGNFIPRFNGTYCLYDTVTQQYFYNLGSGTVYPIFGEVSFDPRWGTSGNCTPVLTGNVITYVTDRNQVEITGDYDNNGDLYQSGCSVYDSYDNLLTLVSNTYDNGVGTLVFDGNIDRVGHLWYNNTHIISVTFPEGMRQFKDGALQYCGLTALTIPSTVLAVGNNSFLGNNITEVTFPDACYWIGRESFMYNPVSSITFGSGTTYIGTRAFEPCSISVCSRPAWDNTTDSLKTIYAYMPNPSSDIFGQPDPSFPTVIPNPFKLRTGAGTLYVPQGSSSYYQDWLTKLPSGWVISDTL